MTNDRTHISDRKPVAIESGFVGHVKTLFQRADLEPLWLRHLEDEIHLFATFRTQSGAVSRGNVHFVLQHPALSFNLSVYARVARSIAMGSVSEMGKNEYCVDVEFVLVRGPDPVEDDTDAGYIKNLQVICRNCGTGFFPDDSIRSGSSVQIQCPQCETRFQLTLAMKPDQDALGFNLRNFVRTRQEAAVRFIEQYPAITDSLKKGGSPSDVPFEYFFERSSREGVEFSTIELSHRENHRDELLLQQMLVSFLNSALIGVFRRTAATDPLGLIKKDSDEETIDWSRTSALDQTVTHVRRVFDADTLETVPALIQKRDPANRRRLDDEETPVIVMTPRRALPALFPVAAASLFIASMVTASIAFEWIEAPVWLSRSIVDRPVASVESGVTAVAMSKPEPIVAAEPAADPTPVAVAALPIRQLAVPEAPTIAEQPEEPKAVEREIAPAKAATPEAPKAIKPRREESNARRFEIMYRKAMIELRDGQVDQSIDRLRGIIKEQRQFSKAYKALGQAYSRRGEFKSAVAALQEYLRLEPQARDRADLEVIIDFYSTQAGN